MTATAPPRARPAALRRRRWLIAVLLVPLAVIPLLLAVGATDPVRFDQLLGANSALVAGVTALAAALGLALTPVLGVMGRIGAPVLAIPVAVLIVNDLRTPEPGPGSTGALSLDLLLSMMVPAGYFVLLFGALRAAGWARAGSAIVLGVAAALSAALWLLPTSPLTDVQMSGRMVAHGLLNAGIIVATAALLWEIMRPRPPAPTS